MGLNHTQTMQLMQPMRQLLDTVKLNELNTLNKHVDEHLCPAAAARIAEATAETLKDVQSKNLSICCKQCDQTRQASIRKLASKKRII